MKYKADWDVVQDRLIRFWEGNLNDCCLAVTAPRMKAADKEIQFIKPANVKEKWLDKNQRLNNWRYEFANTFYGGDAFPNLWVDMGAGIPAAFLGVSPHLGEDSIWFHGGHIIQDITARQNLTIDYSSRWWELTWEMVRFFCENANGDYFVSISDLSGSLDIAASLRSVQQILFDIMDYPNAVRSIICELDEIWVDVFKKNNQLINEYMIGCSDWMNIWCHKTVYSVQCDIGIMMSPDQYEEFVRPSIKYQVESLDYSMYHLHMFDTPCLSAQLDIILGIEKLDGIAFIPEPQPLGEDHGDDKWFPYYKRIQEKGKKLMMFGVKPASALKIIENLSLHGLHLQVSCASESEAKDLLQTAKRYRVK